MKTIYKKGFTLIELLVVIAIIAILALIVLLALNPAEMARRSRDSRRLSDLGTLRSAIDLALADGEALPGTTAAPVTVTLTTTMSTSSFAGGMDISKYLSVIPEDPYSGSSNPQTITDGIACTTGTGVMPAYTFWSDGDTYEINSYMESKENCNAVVSDGGNSSALYEIGTKPGLDGL